MKILVFSDSHRCLEPMRLAVEMEKPDQILHLGDHEQDALRLRDLFPTIPLLYVPGNCDPGSAQPQILTPLIDGVLFLMTHGHLHGVKYSLLRLGLEAKEAGVQIALFGHTHQACIKEYQNVRLFNPGSVRGRYGTYGVLKTDHGVIKDCRIVSTEQ